MPFLGRSHPAYQHHKRSGQARVNLGGKKVDLGVYNSPGSRQKYDQVVGEWIAAGRPRARPKAIENHAVRVADIVVAYFEFIKTI